MAASEQTNGPPVNKVCTSCFWIVHEDEKCPLDWRHPCVSLSTTRGGVEYVDAVRRSFKLRYPRRQLRVPLATVFASGWPHWVFLGSAVALTIALWPMVVTYTSGDSIWWVAGTALLVLLAAACAMGYLVIGRPRWGQLLVEALPGADTDATMRGKIAHSTGTKGPATHTSCAAFGLYVTGATHGRILLSYMRTSGLTIQSDDGRSVVVPAGPLILDLYALPLAEQLDRSALVDSLRRLGVLSTLQGRTTKRIAPRLTGWEVLLRDGDSVEVLNELEPRGASPSGSGYRDNAIAFAPRGTPILRVPFAGRVLRASEYHQSMF